MNHKPISPGLASLVLISVTALLLIAFPMRLEIILPTAQAQETPAATVEAAAQPVGYTDAPAPAVHEYTLRTVLGGTPAMAFQGVGGSIDGQINPLRTASVGDTIRLIVVNGDPVLHDLIITEFGVTTGELTTDEQIVTVEFVVTQPGEFIYFCSIPGHREIGMFGTLRVTGGSPEQTTAQAVSPASALAEPTIEPAAADAVSVVRNPSDVPLPIGDREPITHRIDMRTVEVTGTLADGTTFNYFTFDGQVPGPTLRVRQGDTVDFHLHNEADSLFPHSIDLHSVTGPGGGAVYTQTLPGGETSFTFQALNPGLYVYHCATASIPHHISAGMYGLILVEPPGGLPPVDREFYVMQGDIYTEFPFGTAGHQPFSIPHMRDETPIIWCSTARSAA